MLIPLGVLGLGSLGWISRFTNPTGFTTTAKSIAVDSSGNVYSTGDGAAGGSNNGYVVKTDAEGAIQWQKEFLGAGIAVAFEHIAVDSSGNVYVIGRAENEIQVNKYNTSGTLQWQRRLDAGAGAVSLGSAVAVTSTGTVYIAGRQSQGGVSGIQVAKYNTSGTLQWQKKLSIADQSDALGIALDSSENVYVAGNTKATGTPFAGIVAKYNSSGTLQWQRKVTNSENTDLQNVVTDSSGNAYVVGSEKDGVGDLMILKYDTSGTLQWKKSLVGASYGTSITISGSNLYAITLEASSAAVIAKYDTSGNLQWQRSLTANQGLGITSDTIGNIYVTGRAGLAYFIAKLTDDGTVFGPVSVGGTSFTYQATTYTDTTSASTSSTSTLTDATSSMTSSTTTLTDSTMNFTGVLEAI